MLLDLMDEVKQLKNLVKEKDKKIEGLERRIDDLGQYTRMEDLIKWTGNNTPNLCQYCG